MYRVICFLDNLTDGLLELVLILILLMGFYFSYDTAYVFYHSSAERVAAYRPGSEEEGERSLSEGYVAWLCLNDTGIDYPVMQGEDNTTYLNRDPWGDYSLSGSIFLDSRNAADFSDSYSLIYGHHMDSGLMFGALDQYYEKSFFERHREGTLTVGDLEYALNVFAVLETDADVKEIFDPGSSRAVREIAEETAVYYEEPVNEHIVALSTCLDGETTLRTVVLCTMSDPEVKEQ